MEIPQDKTPFILICSGGIIETTTDILLKINYFQGIINGNFKETTDQQLVLDDISYLACQNIVKYYQSGIITLPTTFATVEECLGLGIYFQANEYIDNFIKVYYTACVNEEKYVEILNVLSLMSRMDSYKTQIGRDIIATLHKSSRLHMLLPDVVNKLITIFSGDQKNNTYLFRIIRGWYLFDRKEDKVTLVEYALQHCQLDKENIKPIFQTERFLNLYPKPTLAYKLAKFSLRG